MKRILNKWQIHWMFRRDIERREMGWKVVEFGVLKIIEFPKEGERLHKPQYKGFTMKFRVWLPVELI